MSRNSAEWLKTPSFPNSHFVDSRIYTDEGLFKEEQEKIFNKSWIIACHESELVNAFDYRTFSHPGGAPLIIVRGEDMQVRSFYNICIRFYIAGVRLALIFFKEREGRGYIIR